MNKIFTLTFLLFSFTVFSQQKSTASKPVKSTPSTSKTTAVAAEPQSSQPQADNPRNTATSSQVRTSEPAKLPYDVNDKYMGRGAEFLGNLTVSELPSDFPAYEKQWSLKEYNQVVTAFYYNHLGIVKEGVKQKLELLQH